MSDVTFSSKEGEEESRRREGRGKVEWRGEVGSY